MITFIRPATFYKTSLYLQNKTSDIAEYKKIHIRKINGDQIYPVFSSLCFPLHSFDLFIYHVLSKTYSYPLIFWEKKIIKEPKEHKFHEKFGEDLFLILLGFHCYILIKANSQTKTKNFLWKIPTEIELTFVPMEDCYCAVRQSSKYAAFHVSVNGEFSSFIRIEYQ